MTSTQPASALGASTFREAMGSFPTGVTVVTVASGDGNMYGQTVNSFSSLSLDPMLTQRPEQRAERPHPALRAQLQSQSMTVLSPSAAKVSAPEVSIIELVVHEPSRCDRSNSVSSTSICVPALSTAMRYVGSSCAW